MVHTDFSDVAFDDLRRARRSARRELELATLRCRRDRPHAQAPGEDTEHLRSIVRDLTSELIVRYRADLDLVDSLLVAR